MKTKNKLPIVSKWKNKINEIRNFCEDCHGLDYKALVFSYKIKFVVYFPRNTVLNKSKITDLYFPNYFKIWLWFFLYKVKLEVFFDSNWKMIKKCSNLRKNYFVVFFRERRYLFRKRQHTKNQRWLLNFIFSQKQFLKMDKVLSDI